MCHDHDHDHSSILVLLLLIQTYHHRCDKGDIDTRCDRQVKCLIIEENLACIEELSMYPRNREPIALDLRASVKEVPNNLKLHGIPIHEVLERHCHLCLEEREMALDLCHGFLATVN